MIHVDRLGKLYQLGESGRRADTLRERLSNGLRPSAWRREARESFWALRDLSFDVRAGEVVGIVGKNGAGKSTLLKILCRITAPTEGRVVLQGRVASLLEVGTGFHPELTGRENIFLNGAILRMARHDIARNFDAIVAFAEIERFLDTPVKRYSSGMYVRLAFAVAAHLDPDILLVDEVLAVGDAAFQSRCLGRMEEVARQGRTVLFVSHNMAALTRLCTRAIHLRQGQLASDGPIETVVREYLRETAEAVGAWRAGDTDGTSAYRHLEAARVLDVSGNPTSVVDFDRGFQVEIEFIAPASDVDYAVAFRLVDQLGVDVFTSWDCDMPSTRSTTRGHRYVGRCRVPPCLVRPGSYVVLPMVESFRSGARDSFERGSFSLRVSDVGFDRFRNRRGVVAPYLVWETVDGNGSSA